MEEAEILGAHDAHRGAGSRPGSGGRRRAAGSTGRAPGPVGAVGLWWLG